MKEQLVYVDRQNTGSVKWDGMKEKYGRDDLLCLWVADMDFKSPRCVQEAYRGRSTAGPMAIPFWEQILQMHLLTGSSIITDIPCRRNGFAMLPE